ncbi:MAG: hypothetical protein Q9223_007460 [Gallowayella weberi]
MFADGEDLGKKDDDRKPGKINLQVPAWSARKPAPWRRRRILYGVVAFIALYLFFKNIPVPEHPPTNFRPTYGSSPRSAPDDLHKSKPVPERPAQKPPRPEKPSDAEKHYYDGPIRFYNLAISLHAIARLWGQLDNNRNVLFAASNLHSASELIPIACEMGHWDRNDVHFALMGRDDLPMDEIKILNSVEEECKINWHDARPNFSPWSSDFRMEVSVAAALGHIQTFMHPQVVITDTQSREDAFFTKAIRAKAGELGKPVVELPPDASEKMMWIARLDSGSLAAWKTTYVDILIHAPPHSSGSLLRLLRSIEAADYFGHRRPHLTIELPAEVDPPTMQYLEGLVWPPFDSSATHHASQVTLRHRVPRRASTVEGASIRLVESFYPARPADSHVLVLSPQVELSPIYFHFLMYHLLECKYSSTAPVGMAVNSLMGLSLELPNMHLNESNMFSPPKAHRKSAELGKPTDEQPTPFLWQSPNSNAALYFGDKWVEFHSFLTSRVSLDPRKIPERPNLVSKSYPAWLEHILELMRARGYTLLYPNFPSSHESIATLHYELFQPPEEFSKPKPKTATGDTPTTPLDPEETFETDPSAHRPKHAESTPLTTTLTSLLPPHGSPALALVNLPLLSHEGNELPPHILESFARSFASDFRRQVGLCAATHKAVVEPLKADDLFCDRSDHRGGLELGELNRDSEQPFASRPRGKEPVVKDDSEVRQSEFEAHLRRQAGNEQRGDEDEEGGMTKKVDVEGPKKEEKGVQGNAAKSEKDGVVGDARTRWKTSLKDAEKATYGRDGDGVKGEQYTASEAPAEDPGSSTTTTGKTADTKDGDGTEIKAVKKVGSEESSKSVNDDEGKSSKVDIKTRETDERFPGRDWGW